MGPLLEGRSSIGISSIWSITLIQQMLALSGIIRLPAQALSDHLISNVYIDDEQSEVNEQVAKATRKKFNRKTKHCIRVLFHLAATLHVKPEALIADVDTLMQEEGKKT